MIRQSPIQLFVPDNPAFAIPHRKNCACVKCEEKQMTIARDPYAVIWKGFRMDPYRIFAQYSIQNGCQQHAIKKLLRAGRSHKDLKTDIKETISTLNRWLEMIEEDSK